MMLRFPGLLALALLSPAFSTASPDASSETLSQGSIAAPNPAADLVRQAGKLKGPILGQAREWVDLLAAAKTTMDPRAEAALERFVQSQIAIARTSDVNLVEIPDKQSALDAISQTAASMTPETIEKVRLWIDDLLLAQEEHLKGNEDKAGELVDKAVEEASEAMADLLGGSPPQGGDGGDAVANAEATASMADAMDGPGAATPAVFAEMPATDQAALDDIAAKLRALPPSALARMKVWFGELLEAQAASDDGDVHDADALVEKAKTSANAQAAQLAEEARAASIQAARLEDEAERAAAAALAQAKKAEAEALLESKQEMPDMDLNVGTGTSTAALTQKLHDQGRAIAPKADMSAAVPGPRSAYIPDMAVALVSDLSDTVESLHAQLQGARTAVATGSVPATTSFNALWTRADKDALRRWLDREHASNPTEVVQRAKEFKRMVLDQKMRDLQRAGDALKRRIERAEEDAARQLDEGANATHVFEHLRSDVEDAKAWAEKEFSNLGDAIFNLTNSTNLDNPIPSLADAVTKGLEDAAAASADDDDVDVGGDDISRLAASRPSAGVATSALARAPLLLCAVALAAVAAVVAPLVAFRRRARAAASGAYLAAQDAMTLQGAEAGLKRSILREEALG